MEKSCLIITSFSTRYQYVSIFLRLLNMTAQNNKTAIKGGLLPQEHYAKRNDQEGVLRRSGYQSGSGVLPSS